MNEIQSAPNSTTHKLDPGEVTRKEALKTAGTVAAALLPKPGNLLEGMQAWLEPLETSPGLTVLETTEKVSLPMAVEAGLALVDMKPEETHALWVVRDQADQAITRVMQFIGVQYVGILNRFGVDTSNGTGALYLGTKEKVNENVSSTVKQLGDQAGMILRIESSLTPKEADRVALSGGRYDERLVYQRELGFIFRPWRVWDNGGNRWVDATRLMKMLRENPNALSSELWKQFIGGK